MKFHVVTLFPGMFESPLGDSLVAKARERGLVDWSFTNPRDFALDKHKSVDDVPYGGGEGMVMKPDVMARALDDLRARVPQARRVFLTPQGRPFTQEVARELLAAGEVVLVCGRYEGVDERVAESRVDDCISLGDYVLGGGELPAMVVMETVFRLVPGVVGNTDSVSNDCFEGGLLKHPMFTRPPVFEGRAIPGVLTSGNHAEVEAWREAQRLQRTFRRRPDLFDRWFDDRRAQYAGRLYVGLLHWPVRNKKGEVVATAVTNSDIHDIARACQTFGVGRYFLITPIEEQRRLVGEILGHWVDGYGARHNPTRKEAIQNAQVVRDLEEARAVIGRRHKAEALTIVTSARESEAAISFAEARYRLASGPRPILLLFGTGWGLTDEYLSCMDLRLEPIRGVGEWNHLSVRSAVSIILDRLLGG
jgi:tRNA (guanine37-N1)-methyltransferase